MIIKGNPAGNVGFWTKHLLRDDTNEKVEVKEISGLAAKDLESALREMQAVASGSRCRGNFMYQANINPLAHEHLTPEQWKEVIDTLERNLGLEGHQRVVIEHIKNGRQHFHIIWNRVDLETMKVKDMGGNWLIHERTARELEARFGLTPTPTKAPNERNQTEQLWERRAAERSGIDPKAMRAELTTLWHSTDSGRAFKAAIEERGYILARGDRCDFCVVDRAGDAPNLVRRLEGVKTAEMRSRMSDVNRAALPSVAEAREKQRATPPRETDFQPNIYNQNEIRRHGQLERDQMLRDRNAASPGQTYDQNEIRRQSQLEREQMRRDRNGASPGQNYDQAKSETFEPRQESQAGAEPNPPNSTEAGLDAGLHVTNKVTGGAEKLTDFVADLLTGGAPPPKRDPYAERVERIIAQRRALAALERIRETMEEGKTLKGEDLQNLTPEHLQNIRSKGDDYLRELISRMEQDRERDRGRERER